MRLELIYVALLVLVIIVSGEQSRLLLPIFGIQDSCPEFLKCSNPCIAPNGSGMCKAGYICKTRQSTYTINSGEECIGCDVFDQCVETEEVPDPIHTKDCPYEWHCETEYYCCDDACKEGTCTCYCEEGRDHEEPEPIP